MRVLIALAFVCILGAVVEGSAIGYDSYAVPKYEYNYAIKDHYGGAQEKFESRIGGLTKEQQSVVVHHHGGFSSQNTQIIRNSGHGIAAVHGLGLGAGLGYGGLY